MKFSNAARKIETNHSISKKEIRLSANAKAFRIILGQIYPDIIKAVVRELFTNAWDSQKSVGNLAKEIEIHSPSSYEPWFSIRDFGSGMSQKTVDDIYSNIFESTKDKSNDEAGTFGMGSKTPLGYQDNFTLISYQNGSYLYYDIYMSENGVPVIDLKDQGETDEPNGVFIQLAVRGTDVATFQRNILHFVFGANTPVKIDGKKFDNKYKIVFDSKDYELVDSETVTSPFVRMGPVLYRLNFDLLSNGYYNGRNNYSSLYSTPIVLKFNIGDFEVTGSREDIIYNQDSKDKIFAVLDTVIEDMKKKIQDDIDSKPNFFEARKALMLTHAGTIQKLSGYSHSQNMDFTYKGTRLHNKFYNFLVPNPDDPKSPTIHAMVTKAFATADYVNRSKFDPSETAIAFSEMVETNTYYATSQTPNRPIIFFMSKTDGTKVTTIKKKISHYFDVRAKAAKNSKVIVLRGDLECDMIQEMIKDFGYLPLISLDSIVLPKEERAAPTAPPPLTCYFYHPNAGDNGLRGQREQFDPTVHNKNYYVPLYMAKFDDSTLGSADTVRSICEYFIAKDTDKKIAMINRTDAKIAKENNLVNIFDAFRAEMNNISLTDEEVEFYLSNYYVDHSHFPSIITSSKVIYNSIFNKESTPSIRKYLYGIMKHIDAKEMKKIETLYVKKKQKVKKILEEIPLLAWCSFSYAKEEEFNKKIKQILMEKNLL